MIPLGLAQAASVRVGNAAGRGDVQAVGPVGHSALILGLGFAILSALVFLLTPEPLIRLFLEGDTEQTRSVLNYAVSLLFMAAAFQIFDTLQVTSMGNLRGLKDTKVPMVIAAISYWPVGLGVAYLLGFTFGFGSVGVWGGLVIGLACAGTAMTWRFEKREALGLI